MSSDRVMARELKRVTNRRLRELVDERDHAQAVADRWERRVILLDRRHRAAAVILDGRADDLLEEIARRGT